MGTSSQFIAKKWEPVLKSGVEMAKSLFVARLITPDIGIETGFADTLAA